MTLAFHPLANIFPLLEGADFDALVEDIKARGLRQAVTLFQGLILDGRNRARACEAAEVDCRYETLPDDIDPIGFVISLNVPRRHLTDGQRAYVAAKLASIGWGGDRSKSPNGDLTTEQAAARLNVAKRAVERARIVRDKATIGLQNALERGLLPVATAAELAVLSEADQLEVLEGDPNSISRRAVALIKKRHRDLRERDLGVKQAALPNKKYGVIYADPEWRFEVYSRDTGMDRSADNHYPTSATDAICARPVGDIAADDCVLFLWATVPMLPDALKVMAAWGFDYKSHCIWTKDRIGTGYWFRNSHELLLVGTRGNIPAPAMGTQWPSTIEGRVTKHSAKPERFYELIEQYFPNLPKIELNARNARPGWDAWGYEAPTDAAGEPLAHDADGVVADPSERGEDSHPSPARQCEQPATQINSSNCRDVEVADGLDIPAFLDRRKRAAADAAP
jgi:N6-adenosine-specific RNA methylase IME4